MDINNFISSFTSSVSVILQNDSAVTYIIYGVVAIAAIGLLYTVRSVLHLHTKLSSSFSKDVFLILVPKERKGERADSGPQEDNITKTREEIAITETLFSSVAGLKKQGGFVKWLTGRDDQISFEIVVANEG